MNEAPAETPGPFSLPIGAKAWVEPIDRQART
jgi:hypothetical protein